VHHHKSRAFCLPAVPSGFDTRHQLATKIRPRFCLFSKFLHPPSNSISTTLYDFPGAVRQFGSPLSLPSFDFRGEREDTRVGLLLFSLLLSVFRRMLSGSPFCLLIAILCQRPCGSRLCSVAPTLPSVSHCFGKFFSPCSISKE